MLRLPSTYKWGYSERRGGRAKRMKGVNWRQVVTRLGVAVTLQCIQMLNYNTGYLKLLSLKNIFYLTPVSRAIIRKSINSKYWRRSVEKGSLLHSLWECKLIQLLWKMVGRFLNKTTIWPSNPTPRHIPWENKNWKRHMYPKVHYSTIYKSEKMEPT